VGIDASPTDEILVEESVIGWKEYELEVMRDTADNVVIICSIENFDPMGVHTGDSITVAPAQTLTDKEYQILRDASLKIIREIGVDTGGSNIQFGVNPRDGRLVVIEMNPKVVKEERKKDDNIYFGDATQESILEHVKISQARAVAIVINDPFATRRIVQNVRQLNDRIYILARTRYLDEIKPLKALGADDVIPEEFETSVAIFRRILDKYLLPKEEIETLVEEIRSDNYKHLRDYVPDYADPVPLKLYLPDVDITSFRIRDGSFMAGKTLMETEMRKKYGVTLLAVNRSAKIISNPPAEMRFEEGDILFVVGEKQRIAEVKSLFNKETAASLEKISTEE